MDEQATVQRTVRFPEIDHTPHRHWLAIVAIVRSATTRASLQVEVRSVLASGDPDSRATRFRLQRRRGHPLAVVAKRVAMSARKPGNRLPVSGGLLQIPGLNNGSDMFHVETMGEQAAIAAPEVKVLNGNFARATRHDSTINHAIARDRPGRNFVRRELGGQRIAFLPMHAKIRQEALQQFLLQTVIEPVAIEIHSGEEKNEEKQQAG